MVRKVGAPPGVAVGVDRIQFLLNVLLRFCGEDPSDPDYPKSDRAPYHNLRLGDFIADPYWLERFEQWMHGLDIAGQTRNHYRSQMSQMYRLGDGAGVSCANERADQSVRRHGPRSTDRP